MSGRRNSKHLVYWQEKLDTALADYKETREHLDWQEERLNGCHTIKGQKATGDRQLVHVRNVCAEVVETQVETDIPSPKVTAVWEQDAEKAGIIEDLLRNLMDKLPMERINDQAERICPTHGGYGLLVEWLSKLGGRGWMGDLVVTLLHPTKIVPQPGVYEVDEMDYIFTQRDYTKAKIKDRFGVDVDEEAEEHPEVRSGEGSTLSGNELVTLNTVYFRNSAGGVGRCHWVGDIELEYMEDYQARRVYRCRDCSRVGNGVQCRYCGGKHFDEEIREYETLDEDYTTALGNVIPAMSQARDEDGQLIWDPEEPAVVLDQMGGASGLLPQMMPGGMEQPVLPLRSVPRMEPTRIPYYKPDVFPVVMRKNVSKWGKFLGGSDIDIIEDQQNGLNKICTKINEKVLGGGSFTACKTGQGHLITDGDNKIMEVEGPADLECIRVYNTQVDISQDLAYRAELYEEARQLIGITDSMQGRRDPTATSAVAKEFSARQATGRMESKRVMKQAAFADLFELLFKFTLAYADEPRPVRSYDKEGRVEYKVFDRRDFLYQDDAGKWHYNTDFLFSCDTAAPLASNREAMWKETRMNYESGTMGNPQEVEVQIMFWTLMKRLNYPMAGQMLDMLRDRQERQQQMAPPAPEDMTQAVVQDGGMPEAAAQPDLTPAETWDAPQYLGGGTEGML